MRIYRLRIVIEKTVWDAKPRDCITQFTCNVPVCGMLYSKGIFTPLLSGDDKIA